MPGQFIAVIGGLGGSQLGDIYAALKADGANVWQPDNPNNQYLTAVAEVVRRAPEFDAVLICHSLACDAGVDAAQQLKANVRLVLIEPVWTDKDAGDVETLWFRCDALLDFPKATVLGPKVTRIIVPRTDHNSICHHPTVLAEVRRFVGRHFPS